jgi:hypothetical protein
MGKINASKSQKEETIAEQSEEEQVDQETEDDSTPLYSDVVSNGSGTISGNSTGTTLLDSTLSGKRTYLDLDDHQVSSILPLFLSTTVQYPQFSGPAIDFYYLGSEKGLILGMISILARMGIYEI